MATADARLVRMETQMATVQSDIAEIKDSVAGLSRGQQEILTSLAVDRDREKQRANTGVWARWLMPFLLSTMLGLLALHSWLDKI